MTMPPMVSNSSAEIDYLIPYQSTVVPVEVKAGKTGTLKSLHLFTAEKHSPLAVRFNTDIPSVVDIAVKPGSKHAFRLLSLPLYLVTQLPRLLK